MAFTVSSLTDYVKEDENLLVMASTFNAKTQSLIQSKGNVLTGVKSSETINQLESSVGFQADSCGWNASGTTTFTQRSVTVGKIKIMEALCPRDLETKYTQKRLQAGSNYDKFGFEKEYSERKAANIAEAVELAIWKGDTTAGNANYARFDGLIKIIDAASGVTEGNTTSITTATGITTSNAVTIFQNMFNAAPARILGKDDLAYFCGWDTFRKLQMNLTNLNLFHYNGEAADGEIIIPGTNIKVYAVHGLNTVTAEGITANDNRIFLMRISNMWLGVDLQNEEDKFEIFHAKEADEIRFTARFKMGTQIAFPAEIVKFTLV